MKKLLMLLLCGGLLAACSSNYSVKVSDSDKVIVSGSELNITKQDYFDYLLKTSGANEVLDEVLLSIADKELTDQKAIDKQVKEEEKTYEQYADGGLDKYAKSLGYSSKDDFVNEKIVPVVKLNMLTKKYIEENLETMISEYQVVSFKKIVVDKESAALAIIKEATTKEAFDKKLKEAGTNGEDAGIVTKNSSLDDNLKRKLKDLSKLDKDGVYSEAIKLSDDKYAVVYVYDTDHKNKDDLIEALANDSNAKEDVEAKYLKKYHFTVNDDKLAKEIKNISDQYLE